MDDSMKWKWERYGALGGIVFVILVIVSIVIAGEMPKSSDSATKIFRYFRENQDVIKVGAFLGTLAGVPILVWAGSLWARLRRAEGGQPRLALVAVLGLVIAGAASAVQSAISATVALDLHAVGPVGSRFFFLLAMGIGYSGVAGIAVLVFATSVLAFRAQAFPAWLGWVGVLDGILFLVAAYGIATTSDGIAVVGLVAFLIWAIWILATSIIMFRTKEAAPAAR